MDEREPQRNPGGLKTDGAVGLSLAVVSAVLFLFVWWLGSGQASELTNQFYRFFGVSVRGNALLFTVLALGLAAGVLGTVFSERAFRAKATALTSAAKVTAIVGLSANAFLLAFSILFAVFFPVA